MGKESVDVPLLSTENVSYDYGKKTSFIKSSVKWVLKLTMWVIFIAWAALMFFYPSQFMKNLFEKWMAATGGSLFGITGSLLLAFSAPLFIIALLSVIYLIISGDEEDQQKKTSKRPSFKLWTFPVFVDGPFGVVSAAEFIGILLFVIFVVWAVYAYTLRNLDMISQFHLSSFYRSCVMLELTGLRFGLIGLFCLAFLFLPVARGSILLRFIDIPFEHATRYHVWLGHLTMVLFTLHGLLYAIPWAMEGRIVQEMLEWKEIGVANLAGVISLIAGLLMWVTSLPGVRTKNFELFFYTHQLYVVFVIFLAFHVGDFIFSMAAGGIFLFMLDRFLRFIQSRKTVDIISATSLPCGTLELVLSKPTNLRYNALSFIFLQVRELSWLQWHPFSVSSSPLEGRNHLSVLIKVLGEWTAKLKRRISNNEQQQEKLVESGIQSLVTASVEGPYGHESPYHLTYKYLILVAGGIGISPFLAVLSDILHRIEEGKPCLPTNILIIWAIKKTDELPLLSMLNAVLISRSSFDALNLVIHVYVTREAQPSLEEGKPIKVLNIPPGSYPVKKRSAMSGLVGTGENIWAGTYVVASTIGFIGFLALMDAYYINPYGIKSWWYKGLLLLICMVAGIVIVGGCVVVLWFLWERRMLASEEHEYQTQLINNAVNGDENGGDKNETAQRLVDSCDIRYGCRPNFTEIFGSVSEQWGAVDVGVLVCGPPALQSSVASTIRSLNLKRSPHHPILHFNSHSFDL